MHGLLKYLERREQAAWVFHLFNALFYSLTCRQLWPHSSTIVKILLYYSLDFGLQLIPSTSKVLQVLLVVLIFAPQSLAF
jgi:hypothetical protein